MRQGVTEPAPALEQSSAGGFAEQAWRLASRLPVGRRRRPRLSPMSAVDRGLATLGLVWEGLWLLPDPSLWPTNQGSAIESVLLGGAFATWVAVVATAFGPLASRGRRVRAQVANVCLLFAAGLALLHFAPAADPGAVMGITDWQAGASLINLACALTGLLVATSVAIPVILGAALAELTLLRIDLAAAPTPGDDMSTLLYPTYALAMGAAAVGARHGLFAAARRSEGARAALELAEAQAQALRGAQRRMREQQRLLHETVLNTLTAISRGGISRGGNSQGGAGVSQGAGPPAADSRMRTRCAESALVLRALGSAEYAIPATGSRDWAADVRAGTQQLVDAGVHVEIRVGAAGRSLPDNAYGAMVTAVREAMANAARHANADTVAILVSVSADERARRDHWTVEVRDDGTGFDAAGASWRFGLSSAIVQAMEDVGGEARVWSLPGEGTCVTLAWSTTPESRAVTVLGESATSVNALGAPVLVSFGVFSLLSMILTISEFEFPRIAAAGFIIALACGVLLVWFGRAGTLPPALVLGVCVAVPVVYRLQQIGLGAGDTTPWSDWSSEAIVALLLIVAGTGPWWGWIAALAAWLMTQGDMVAELVRPGTAVIIAGALFARSVRANDRAYAAAMRQRRQEESSSAGDEASIRALARRYGPLAESPAVGLLEGIAEGTIDADAAGVRAACRLEEHFIRTLMRVDPAASPLHAFALQLALRGHRRGIELDLDIAEAAPVDRRDLLLLRISANRVISHALPGAPARLSARREEAAFMVRLVVRVAAIDEGAVVEALDGQGLTWHVDPSDSTIILEARYA